MSGAGCLAWCRTTSSATAAARVVVNATRGAGGCGSIGDGAEVLEVEGVDHGLDRDVAGGHVEPADPDAREGVELGPVAIESARGDACYGDELHVLP